MTTQSTLMPPSVQEPPAAPVAPEAIESPAAVETPPPATTEVESPPPAKETPKPEGSQDSSAEETPAPDEIPDGEELVRMVDYKKLEEKYNKLIAGMPVQPEAPAEPSAPEAPVTPAPAAPQEPARPATSSFFEADMFTDDFMQAQGFEPTDVRGRDIYAKQFNAFGEAVYNRAITKIMEQQTEAIQTQTVAYLQGLEVAKAVGSKYPELLAPGQMPKTLEAVKLAMRSATPDETLESIAERAKLEMDKAVETVATYKRTGGKIIRQPGASPMPPASTNAAAPRAKPPTRGSAGFNPNASTLMPVRK